MSKNVNSESYTELQATAKERTVKTQNIEYDLETLVGKIDSGLISLNPDYQRNHRWDEKTSSRLIESLILNIPIPTIYLSLDIDVDTETEGGLPRYSVIDGQQRLTAITEYMSNKFALVGLDVLGDLNGKKYEDLPPFLIRRLEERTINCLRIDSTVDAQVKYDIFERLNSGSVQLTPQELRNAIYRGPFNDMIKEVAKSKLFLEMINVDISKQEEDKKIQKMENAELVLRFFAFYRHGYDLMKKSFLSFLSEQMSTFSSLEMKEIVEMQKHFMLVLKEIEDNFHDDNPFAKYKEKDGQLKLTVRFHSAVYDAVSIAVSENILDRSLLIDKNRMTKYKKLFYQKEEFADTISGSTNDKSKIVKRISIVRDIFKK